MAPNEIDVLTAKLNRLNKSDLIEIIVCRKVPENLTNSPYLDYITLKQCVTCGIRGNEIAPTNLDNTILESDECQISSCIRNKVELECKHSELISINRLNVQLEARINDLEEIIRLLKMNEGLPNKKTNFTNSSNSNEGTILTSNACSYSQSAKQKSEQNVSTPRVFLPPSQPKNHVKQAGSQQNKPFTSNNKQISQQKHVFTNSQIAAAIDGATPSNKPADMNNFSRPISASKNKPIIGTGKCNLNIQIVPKQGYLHAYRFSPATTVEDLQNHLKSTAPDIDFTCSVWNKKEHSMSFKIIFPIKDVQRVYDTNIWPEGVAVQRFRFPKQNFFQADNEPAAE